MKLPLFLFVKGMIVRIKRRKNRNIQAAAKERNMTMYIITETDIQNFGIHLRREERSSGTVEKYLLELNRFRGYLNGREVKKTEVSAWKERLLESGKAPVTVNGCLAALHSFFAFMGWEDCRVKYLKIQRQMFRDVSRELDRGEYQKLVEAALAGGKHRLALLIETICGTGVRVSEVRYITVEAARRGQARISMKGKIRTILIPSKLSRKLLKYAQKEKIASGEIFLTKSGRGLTRGHIWSEMKRLCKAAKVEATKVFPHNLRHLFARMYYKASRDIVQLADILGHSSVETTRIYLITTGEEHARCLNRLGLVL